MGQQETIAHGIINLNELLRKYFLLLKPIAEHTELSTFIQLNFIQSSKYLRHNLSFIIEISLKCIFHSTVLNQPPVHSTLRKYSSSLKSFLKMDENKT